MQEDYKHDLITRVEAGETIYVKAWKDGYMTPAFGKLVGWEEVGGEWCISLEGWLVQTLGVDRFNVHHPALYDNIIEIDKEAVETIWPDLRMNVEEGL